MRTRIELLIDDLIDSPYESAKTAQEYKDKWYKDDNEIIVDNDAPSLFYYVDIPHILRHGDRLRTRFDSFLVVSWQQYDVDTNEQDITVEHDR